MRAAERGGMERALARTGAPRCLDSQPVSLFAERTVTVRSMHGVVSSSKDAWITAKTKIAIITASHMPSDAVHVDTSDARVLLHGSVATQLERQNAEAIASSMKGVLGVQNLLQVIPSTRASVFAVSDERTMRQSRPSSGASEVVSIDTTDNFEGISSTSGVRCSSRDAMRHRSGRSPTLPRRRGARPA